MRPRPYIRRAVRRLFPVAPLVAAALLLAPAATRAQATTFYLDRLQVAGAPGDGLGVWRPEIGPSRLFGQIAFGYAHNPLRVNNIADTAARGDALSGAPVSDQLTTYFTFGAEILERASVSASFPLIVFQQGHPTDASARGLHDAVAIADVAPSDLRLDGRVVLIESDQETFRLGFRGALFLPTGDELSYAGDAAAWGNVGASAELDFTKVSVALNLGISIRPDVRFNDLRVGSEVTYGIAAYVPFAAGRLRLGAEISGSKGLLSQTGGAVDATPLEGSVNARFFGDQSRSTWIGLGGGARLTSGYAPDARVVALFGGAFAFSEPPPEPKPAPPPLPEPDADKDGIGDIVDTCPGEAEDQVNPEDGCPEPADRDNDGIITTADKCPDDPEDKDGIDDADGCPELDADADNVPDNDDKCPKEPGVRGDDPAKRGCPQFIHRANAEVELVQQLEFELGKSTIVKSSYPILDEIAGLLRTNPEIKLVAIDGHTDNQGVTDFNQKLSQARASAVRDYLIKHGIAGERLVATGYGSSKPLATNDTPEGRAKNRRVEFHIVKQSAAGP